MSSCTQKNNTNVKGEEINAEDYLKSKDISNNGNYEKISFRIVSNPYSWDENSHLILYLNNHTIYSGMFSLSGNLKIQKLEPNQSVHFRMEVINNNQLFRYENKSVFNWDNEYKYIYIGLFPDNPSTDNIHFFPQKAEVIQ